MARRNITDAKRVVLNLIMKPIIAARAKEQQTRKPVDSVYQNSDKQITEDEPLHTTKEIAKASGVSHDTVHKVERVMKKADEDTKELPGEKMTENQTLKLLIQPDIVEAIQAELGPNQSMESWLIEHLASHFGLEERARRRTTQPIHEPQPSQEIEDSELLRQIEEMRTVDVSKLTMGERKLLAHQLDRLHDKRRVLGRPQAVHLNQTLPRRPLPSD